jgi:glycosyltransferase involved in cell wall biosynthesis
MRSVTVLLPALNEADNLVEVIPEIAGVLQDAGYTFDVLVVDDGSTDNTQEVVAKLAAADRRVRYLKLRRNFGKSAALQAGFGAVTGEVVVLMDADGQDDPHAVPVMIEKLDEGYGLVTGSRVGVRRDRFIKRNTSKIFNKVTTSVTGVAGTDFNSGLKAMRRAVADHLYLYGEMHRYIPVLAHWAGYPVTEVSTNHRARRYGTTKFGSARFWRGFLDLFTVQFITRFTARPLHLFGGVGILSGLAGAGLLAWMLVDRVLGQTVGNRPALLAGVMLVVLGVQFISIGLIGELIVHSRGRSDVDWMIDS